MPKKKAKKNEVLDACVRTIDLMIPFLQDLYEEMEDGKATMLSYGSEDGCISAVKKQREILSMIRRARKVVSLATPKEES